MTGRELVRQLALVERLLAVAAELDPAALQCHTLLGIVRDLQRAIDLPEPPLPVWVVIQDRRAALRDRTDTFVDLGLADALYWEWTLEDLTFVRDVVVALRGPA